MTVKVQTPCTCPPKANGEPRHERDTFVFRDRLDFRSGMVIRKSITVLRAEDPDAGSAEVLAALAEHYLVEGIESWSRVDEKGKPLEADKTAIRRFLNEHDEIVFDHLVDEADALYYEQVLAPLVRKAQALSQPSPTEPSTSPGTGSEEKPPKPSRRSSTRTTQTADITPITRRHAGDSSTSRRSA